MVTFPILAYHILTLNFHDRGCHYIEMIATYIKMKEVTAISVYHKLKSIPLHCAKHARIRENTGQRKPVFFFRKSIEEFSVK